MGWNWLYVYRRISSGNIVIFNADKAWGVVDVKWDFSMYQLVHELLHPSVMVMRVIGGLSDLLLATERSIHIIADLASLYYRTQSQTE